MSRTRLKHAFTLIELLVVISIVALLIAILLPALQKAREVATQTKCLSAERQLAIALSCYTDDNKVFPPIGASVTDTTTGSYWVTPWHKILWKKGYMATYKIAICPAMTKLDSACRTGIGLRYDGRFPAVTYDRTTKAATRAYFETNFQMSRKTLMLDSARSSGAENYSFIIQDRRSWAKEISDRHKGSNNITFMDGHAVMYKTSAIDHTNWPSDLVW